MTSPATESMRLLNVGCGSRFHPRFTNIDQTSTGPGVLAHDITRPLPFADASFDVVYHSHVLEHLPRALAPVFLGECRRVLREGGILRVVVPDLEQIARLYLEALQRAMSGEPGWSAHYDWIMLELLDQVARHRSGGAMLDYLRAEDLSNRDFVIARLGTEAAQFIGTSRSDPVSTTAGLRPWQRMRTSLRRVRGAVRSPRVAITRRLLGAERTLLDLGRFRSSGEIHHWMYDRYSLARLLTECGFRDPHPVAATESAIPDWSAYHLDNEPDGRVYKPDSLFMEARRSPTSTR